MAYINKISLSIGKLDIFPLMCAADIVWILNWKWSTQILGQFVTRMRKFFCQSDAKHIITSPIKKNPITSVLKASTDIITNSPARPIGLAEI
jgi:hypothetical protein